MIRYTSHVPRSHGLYTEGFVPFQKLVQEEMGDRLQLIGYMDKLLHGPLDGFKASVTGISDYTHGYAGYQPGSFQLLHALQLPFLFASPPVASLVAEELYPKHFKAEYERMGVYLAHYDTTSAYSIISRRPIRTLEDMQGIKMRVHGWADGADFRGARGRTGGHGGGRDVHGVPARHTGCGGARRIGYGHLPVFTRSATPSPVSTSTCWLYSTA